MTDIKDPTDGMSWDERRALLKEAMSDKFPEHIESVDDLLEALDYEDDSEGEEKADESEEWLEVKTIMETIPVYLLDMESKGAQSADPRAARLRVYWTTGVGGTSKIRWGQPGDGKRCIRHLRKYIRNAPGYCQNLHQQMVGGTAMGHGPGEHKDDVVGTVESEGWQTKRQFTAEERHKAHTVPGTDSFPIENEQDLRNAIRAIGRAKPSDRAKVRAHIITQAKRLGLMDLVPDDWKPKK